MIATVLRVAGDFPVSRETFVAIILDNAEISLQLLAIDVSTYLLWLFT
jgi:hypothetical protein